MAVAIRISRKERYQRALAPYVQAHRAGLRVPCPQCGEVYLLFWRNATRAIDATNWLNRELASQCPKHQEALAANEPAPEPDRST